MKKSELKKIIKETIIGSDGNQAIFKLINGEYNGMDEFIELWRIYFKSRNLLQKTLPSLEDTLERPLTNDEKSALNSAGLIWNKTQTTSDLDDYSDIVRDLKSTLGTGRSLESVSRYLGRRLSKPEIRALISARVINPKSRY